MKREKLDRNRPTKYITCIVYFVFWALILFLHKNMTYISDDKWYIDNVAKDSISIISVMRKTYIQGTGKFLTDTVGVLLIYMPLWIWKILDSCIYVAAAKMITYIIAGKDELVTVFVVCISLFLFPFNYLASAGYVMTSANYVYTIFGILLSLVPIRMAFDKGRASVITIVFGCIGSLYASNQEQSAVAIGSMFLGILLFLILCYGKQCWVKRGSVSKIVIMQFAVVLCGIAIMFFSPGHIIRSVTKTGQFAVPGYSDWNFFNKMYHGYTATVANVIFQPLIVYTVLCVMLFIYELSKKDIRDVLITSIPLFFSVWGWTKGYSKFIVIYDYAFGMPELRKFGDGALHLLVPLAVSVIVFGCLLVAIYRLFDNHFVSMFFSYLMIMACGTRLMMGLSPTLYGSSFRTFTYLLYFFIFMIILLIRRIIINAKANWIKILTLSGLIILAFFNYLYEFSKVR